MRLAVVVPTLRDDAALANLLPRLAQLEPSPEQIVVVDGAASTSTESLCRRHGASWMAAAPGRGRQLAAGAAEAGGPAEILWFIHADAEPHPGSVAAIREAVAQGASGGYFRFRFGGESSRLKRFIESCIALRCRVAMVYGDQGIFVTQSAYAATPGFLPQPLFEEVGLVRALKRTGRFVALDLPIGVSPRRWERDGFIRRSLHNRMLALAFAFGVDPAKLARWYRVPRA